MRVDPTNTEQLTAWDGGQGAFWAKWADRFDEGVAAYRDHLLAAAAIQPTDAVVDIGCGAGQTTRDAARLAPEGSALGVDLSSPMLDLARERAGHLANVTFLQADAQVHPFPPESFDLALSRHGAMFFGDPPAAFTNLARSLRPTGRLALLTWQPPHRNEWVSTFRAIFAGPDQPAPKSPPPFSLSDPDHVHPLLTTAGFTDVQLHGLEEPMYFGRDVDDACDFLSGQFSSALRTLDADAQTHVLDTLRANLADHQTPHGIHYDSAAWLITAHRA
ncbi:Methyltransferase domain-containing protein [Actinokineospora alba]|uniref:Methyltransferase domain-containing protein n=1 Tax=Actinokineospora alba TaxID=504798 RepID=A0A1H0G2Z3_9PSEU|nr:methyltransferase domain-containing protein [Actinokineospora alba]TDP69736.1 methyltransferase family protein [Actinokineospora alba]SDI09843.1 Methyltransferase domain-containing protein [Actinokineospora alba]SDO01201.1 Methyltransferase domain-containing protein [Actinokineospora alba]